MDQQNISGSGSVASQYNANVFSADQISSLDSAVSDQLSYDQSVSSISPSNMEAMVTLLAAGIPSLQFPNIVMTSFSDFANSQVSGASAISGITNNNQISNSQITNSILAADLATIELAAEKMQSDIVTNMWKKFQEDIQQLAAKIKQEDIDEYTKNVAQNGPKSASEYLAYTLALTANRRAEELGSSDQSPLSTQFNQAFNYWMVTPTQQTDSTVAAVSSNDRNAVVPKNSYPDPSFIAGCVVCNSDSVRTAIGAAAGAGVAVGAAASVASLSPVSDAYLAVGPNTGLPMETQAAAAMIAALLNGGAVMKATGQTIDQAVAKGQPPQDLDFAKNYAKQILAIVTHDSKEGGGLSKQQNGQNGMIKLMLATMALNMVYRAAYGGMSGGEFAAFFKVNSADPSQGPTSKLPSQIKDVIDDLLAQIEEHLPTDPENRSNLLVSLMEYVDSKESVDTMLQTTRQFTEALATSTSDINQKRFLAKES